MFVFAGISGHCDSCVAVNTLRCEVGYWRAMHRKAKRDNNPEYPDVFECIRHHFL